VHQHISSARYHLALRANSQAQLPTWPRLERRHQTIRLRDRHWIPTSVASFRRRRPSPYERNAAISRHFERDPISYALETDWLGRRDSNLCISKSDLLNFIPPQRVLGIDRVCTLAEAVIATTNRWRMALIPNSSTEVDQPHPSDRAQSYNRVGPATSITVVIFV